MAEQTYSWLTVNEDGSIGCDMRGTTPAEADRRLVIAQEIRARRILPASEVRELVEALQQAANDLDGMTRFLRSPEHKEEARGLARRARAALASLPEGVGER